jgi:outer membrane protein OmpA-like peptidoglycan-associated protein
MPDSMELTAGEITRLRETAAALVREPGKSILLGGHTARAGNAQGWLRVSTERALAAADSLIRMNAPLADRIVVLGYGAGRPLGDEATEAGRAMNRRVEIITAEPHGAASTRVPADGVSVNTVRFLPDSAELTAGERSKLRETAAALERYPEKSILLSGHTARAGNAQGRLRVSAERALAVADFLVGMNAQLADRIIILGYGAERPLGDEAAETDKAMNRRVEIILQDEERP